MYPSNTAFGPIIITMRFSLLLRNSRSWEISRKSSFEDYRDILFSKNRLNSKFYMFEKLCLPSLIGQRSENPLKLIVFCSSELPIDYKKRLEDLLNDINWARVVYVDPDRNPNHDAETLLEVDKAGAEFYAHVRLDDDDALARNFAQCLSRYISPQFCGYGVSFGMGCAGIFSETESLYKSFWDFYEVKASCGLSYIGQRDWLRHDSGVKIRSAYGLGSHKTVDQRCPLIVDSSAPMFLYSIYRGQDTGGIAEKKLKREVSMQFVQEHFSISVSDLINR